MASNMPMADDMPRRKSIRKKRNAKKAAKHHATKY
jgi:hypothetical protein